MFNRLKAMAALSAVVLLSVAAFAQQTIILIGDGSRISLGASVKEVAQQFQGLSEGEQKGERSEAEKSLGIRKLKQDNFYRSNLQSRMFYFYQNKLYKVVEDYGSLSTYKLLNKLTPVYGSNYQEKQEGAFIGVGTNYIWKYSRNLTVTLTHAMIMFFVYEEATGVSYYDPVIDDALPKRIEAEEKRLSDGKQAKEERARQEEERAEREEQAKQEAAERARQEKAAAEAKMLKEIANAEQEIREEQYRRAQEETERIRQEQARLANEAAANAAAKEAAKAEQARRSIATFTDSRDNMVYKKVTIGTQTWMGENLNYDVPKVKTDVCYDKKKENCAEYGRLYDWPTAVKACPAGWHLPSYDEWETLVYYVGGERTAGKMLKSGAGWIGSGNGTNNYGFSALPGGRGDGKVYDGGENGYWWSALENSAKGAWFRRIDYNDGNVKSRNNNKTDLLSVRCVQDVTDIDTKAAAAVEQAERLKLEAERARQEEERRAKEEAEAYNNKGNSYYNKKDYDRAIAEYNEATRLNPNYADAYANKGHAYYYKGDYDRAIANYNEAIRLNPNLDGIYNYRGNAYYYKDDYARAFANYNQAIRLNSNDAEAYYNRGNAYMDKDNYDRAIEDYNEAIRINPTGDNIYWRRGNAYHYKDEEDRAIADYNEAIRLNPNHSGAYFGRGNAYYYKEDYDQAIANYNEAIRINPTGDNIYWRRGNAYMDKENYDQAIADYSEAIRLDPNHSNAYFGRGNAYYYKDEEDRAIADWESTLRIDPNYAKARRNIEIAKEKLGR